MCGRRVNPTIFVRLVHCPHIHTTFARCIDAHGDRTSTSLHDASVCYSFIHSQTMDLPSEPSDVLIWREEPHFRGTFAILTSCVGTLLVCTWSALHDDIPHGKSKIRRRLHQCVWLVMSLLAPELLLLIAFDQFWTAYNLTKDGQRWLPSEQEQSGNVQVSPPLSLCNETSVHCTHSQDDVEQAHTQAPHGTANSLRTRKHPWTRTHSFYAIMGGFVLQDPHESPAEPYLPSWQRNGVLTPDGVRLIMKHRPYLIPDIPRSELLDRSKADDLGKAVLVWQVLWFCLSCLNRAIQGLPLCLLEVTTIAHAFCALLTYAFWWSKPKNIHHPTLLAGDSRVRDIGAWMSIRSGAQRPVIGGLITFSLSPELIFTDALQLSEHLATRNRARLLELTGKFSSKGYDASAMRSTLSRRPLPPYHNSSRKVRFI